MRDAKSEMGNAKCEMRAAMSDTKKVGDLEIAQDLKFQHAEWRFQRVGWLIMLVVVIAALAGAFGRGPLAHATARAGDGSFELDYDRIARHFSNNTFQFKLRADTPANLDTIGIWFESEYLEGLDLQQITPTPIRMASGQGRTTFYFEAGPGARIEFNYQPDAFGRRRSGVGIEQGASTYIRQFILP